MEKHLYHILNLFELKLSKPEIISLDVWMYSRSRFTVNSESEIFSLLSAIRLITYAEYAVIESQNIRKMNHFNKKTSLHVVIAVII